MKPGAVQTGITMQHWGTSCCLLFCIYSSNGEVPHHLLTTFLGATTRRSGDVPFRVPFESRNRELAIWEETLKYEFNYGSWGQKGVDGCQTKPETLFLKAGIIPEN